MRPRSRRTGVVYRTEHADDDRVETAFVCADCRCERWIDSDWREEVPPPPLWMEVCQGLGKFTAAYLCDRCSNRYRV